MDGTPKPHEWTPGNVVAIVPPIPPNQRKIFQVSFMFATKEQAEEFARKFDD